MKKLTLTTAVFVAMSATSVLAHHPSAAMSPMYEDVNDRLIEMEVPHAEMDMYEIGNADGMLAGTANRETSGWVYAQEQSGAVPPLDPPVDTTDLMEDVDTALAE